MTCTGTVTSTESTSFQDLPAEIFLAISSFLPRRDLSSFARVTKSLHDLTQPILYEVFSVPINIEDPGFTRFLRTILENPVLSQYVKRVDTAHWSSEWTFQNRYGPFRHRKPLSKDVRVIYAAIKSLPLPADVKKEWINGLAYELFCKDANLSGPRQFGKADSFLAVLLAKLPNLENLRLSLYCCDKKGHFPKWTWKILELCTSSCLQEANTSFARLKDVAIHNTIGLLDGANVSPWLRFRSLTKLELRNVNIPNNLEIPKRSSHINILILINVVAGYKQLATLLETPNCLTHVEYMHGFESATSQTSVADADLLKILQRFHAASLETLVLDSRDCKEWWEAAWTEVEWNFPPISDRKQMRPGILRKFEKLHTLEIGQWHLVGFDWYDIDPASSIPPPRTNLPRLVDVLPSNIAHLTIRDGDIRLESNLGLLAAARKYPAYRFRYLKSVKIMMLSPLDFEAGLYDSFGECRLEVIHQPPP